MEGLVNRIHPFNFHLDATIIQKDATTHRDFFGQLVVGDCCNRLVASHLFGCQRELITLRKRDRTIFESTKANLWTLKILKNSNVGSQFVGHLPNRGNPFGVLTVISMGEIQSKRGRSGLDEFTDPFRTFRCGPDGGHDLGSTG
jgi:hypothetical protein